MILVLKWLRMSTHLSRHVSDPPLRFPGDDHTHVYTETLGEDQTHEEHVIY